MKKVIQFVGVSFIFLLAIGLVVYAQSESLPEGKEGAEADAFARKMMEAVNSSAWDSTAIVKWSFMGKRHHVWDRKRHLAEVKWGKKRVLIDLTTREGIAYKNGEIQTGKDKEDLLKNAWEAWVNDSFWLNAVVKSFDEGVSRKLVKLKDGSDGLLVTFGSGGVTPGDSYLWEVDPETFRPVSWKMWVQIMPIKGVKVGWSDWKQLPSGAWIAESRGGKMINMKMDGVEETSDIKSFFDGKDPFDQL